MREVACTVAALAALATLAPPVAGQELVAALSTDSVALAEAFELEVRVPVPAGSIVYFPDTLPATPDVESAAPVEWRAARGPDGGATLTLTYALRSFGEGAVALPRLDVTTMPAEDADEGERLPGGSLVGSWASAPLSMRYTRSVGDVGVWVEPAYTADDIEGGMFPRPPGDVVGWSWSLPSLALLLLFASVIGGAVVTTTRSWLAARPDGADPGPTGPTSLDEARRRALAELDRLLAAGPHSEERAREVYADSSGTVRGYVERLDPRWGPDLTSTELMDRLAASGRASAPLGREMRAAEAVKFGRSRPAASATEAHLRALRSWVGASDTLTAGNGAPEAGR